MDTSIAFELVGHMRSVNDSCSVICRVKGCKVTLSTPSVWYWHVRHHHPTEYMSEKPKRSYLEYETSIENDAINTENDDWNQGLVPMLNTFSFSQQFDTVIVVLINSSWQHWRIFLIIFFCNAYVSGHCNKVCHYIIFALL